MNCFVKDCSNEAFYDYKNSPRAFRYYFKNRLACESHKLDGDVDVRTGVEYVEKRPNAFKIKRLSRSGVIKRLRTAIQKKGRSSVPLKDGRK